MRLYILFSLDILPASTIFSDSFRFISFAHFFSVVRFHSFLPFRFNSFRFVSLVCWSKAHVSAIMPKHIDHFVLSAMNSSCACLCVCAIERVCESFFCVLFCRENICCSTACCFSIQQCVVRVNISRTPTNSTLFFLVLCVRCFPILFVRARAPTVALCCCSLLCH